MNSKIKSYIKQHLKKNKFFYANIATLNRITMDNLNFKYKFYNEISFFLCLQLMSTLYIIIYIK